MRGGWHFTPRQFTPRQHLKNSNRQFDQTKEAELLEQYELALQDPLTLPLNNSEQSDNVADLNKDIEMWEIEESIEKQKTSAKSADPDKLHPCVLKHLGPTAKQVLVLAYNHCLAPGWNNLPILQD